MYEIIPIAAGLVAALALRQVADSRLRWIALLVTSLVVGFIAATVSGEISTSPLFVLWDAVQVVLAAVILGVVLERRSARRGA